MNETKKGYKHFYRTLFVLALPIFISNMLSTTLSMVDTIMIGRLGETAIAGVGLANRLAIFINLVTFGVSSGFSVFSSQYFGAKNYEKIRKITGLTIAIALFCGILFSSVFAIFPKFLIGIFTSDSATITLGADYLRIICASMTFGCLSFALMILCRSIRVTVLPMIASVMGLVTNTFLNYCLIFGKFGFPLLGVKGAAIATVIARIVEFSILYIALFKFSKNKIFDCGFKDYLGWDKELVCALIKTSSPVILNEFLWNIGTMIYLVIIGVMGPVYIAIMQICNTVMNFMQAGFTGIGSACGVILGNEIGRGNLDLAKDYSKRIMRLFTVFGLCVGVLLYIGVDVIISLFSVAPQTVIELRGALKVCAIFSVFCQMSYIYIVSIFRSGGDTKFAAAAEIVSVYFIAIPLIALSIHFKLSPVWVMLAMRMEDLGKNIICYPRYKSFKWLNKVI